MKFAEELAKFSRIAEEKGLVNSLEGNLSLIDRETGIIYITPSHRMKSLLTAEDICAIAPDGTQVGGSGKRSSEFFLHEAAFAARPDANAAVHCHTPFLTAYALQFRDFVPPADCFVGKVLGTFTCLPYGEHGTHEIHRGIEDALKHSSVVLLGGHGVVCVGSDPEDAIGIMEAAENLAKTVWIQSRL